ncbi:hypothetical protein CLV25_10997 [Acetobacteroides hydrogenigenes]|uniref:Uncharacterized protein n=1 Tax=Acetobacteroides hydrogenigenes TaxID=979970 RepID=A0A4R2ECA0_9BACT|nr:hypothetical protein CLV25_10997 [Acetobacteroides hydrogenigenes]
MKNRNADLCMGRHFLFLILISDGDENMASLIHNNVGYTMQCIIVLTVVNFICFNKFLMIFF